VFIISIKVQWCPVGMPSHPACATAAAAHTPRVREHRAGSTSAMMRRKKRRAIVHAFIGTWRFYHSEMHLRKQSDESSDASEQSCDEAAPGQARPCDAGPKRYRSSLDGKFHTITLPSSSGKQRQAIASALAPMMSDYKFAWHVHNFALIKKLPMTTSEPHACYSFLQQPPPDMNLEDFDFSHEELFIKRRRLHNGRFARGHAKESTAFFSATSSARAHIGGGALVSWLVHVLVTGKNVSKSFYAARIRQDQQCCARESRAVLSRRHWGICSNIKVID
jgi:hypothetical protein